MLRRCLYESDFLAHLQAQCTRRAPLFSPAEEQRAVRKLLRDLSTLSLG